MQYVVMSQKTVCYGGEKVIGNLEDSTGQKDVKRLVL